MPAPQAYRDRRVLNTLFKLGLSLCTLQFVSWMLRLPVYWEAYVIIPAVRITLSFFWFNDYKISWSKASYRTAYLKFFMGLLAFLIYAPPNILFGFIGYRVILTDFVFYHFFTFSIIYTYRLYYYQKNKTSKTIIIYGAGKAGSRIKQSLQNSGHRVLWFIDDSTSQQRSSIDGWSIYSLKESIQRLKRIQKIDRLVFAIPKMSAEKRNRRINRLSEFFDDIKVLPPKSQLLRDKDYISQLKNVEIEDLLARHPADLDTKRISDFIRGKSILVTGGAGSIGSELVRQSKLFGARSIIILDHSEINLYTLNEELGENTKYYTIMTTVTSQMRMEKIFERFKPEIVLHAAAYKHVPLCEVNPGSAIFNNVVGTQKCIDLAIKYKVEKFVLVSTDKAVRPTNVMGCTKRVCELYAQNSNGLGVTDIVAVRFGNVLGSSGSVIPKFKSLIEQNQNLTVTHPDITRYFMLIPEACELVLQAASIGSGGEIFILDMGEPVKIADLANRMLKLYNRPDLKVVYTGLRPGEKLYEELIKDDTDKKTQYESITVASPTPYDIEQLRKDIEELIRAEDKIAALQKIVPEFIHKPHGLAEKIKEFDKHNAKALVSEKD